MRAEYRSPAQLRSVLARAWLATVMRPTRRSLLLALIGLVAALAVSGFLLFSGEARSSFIRLAVVLVLLPLLAAGLIPLLARLGLIDEEAAGRMGCLHGLGLIALPVVVLALYAFPGGPLMIVALPALILGAVYGGDVWLAIAFRLGLTKRRSFIDRTRSNRRMPRPSCFRDPGRATLASAVDGTMAVLRATERDHYGPGQAVGRLLLVVVLPMFLVGVIGVIIAAGGYDGTLMIFFGFVGTAICLIVGLALVRADDGT